MNAWLLKKKKQQKTTICLFLEFQFTMASLIGSEDAGCPSYSLSHCFHYKNLPSSFFLSELLDPSPLTEFKPLHWNQGIIFISALTLHLQSTDNTIISFLLSFISFTTVLLWTLISLLKYIHNFPTALSATSCSLSNLLCLLSYLSHTPSQRVSLLGDLWWLVGPTGKVSVSKH